MKMCVKYLLFFFITIVYSKQCYWSSLCYYSYYGSKTPYDDVRGDIRDAPEIEDCEPVSVWAMIRHGTRHPGEDDIVNMKAVMTLKDILLQNYTMGQGEMCAQDISNLRNWTWNDAIDNTPSHLTPEGFEELHQMGGRFREKFMKLLDNLDYHYFKPTNEQRTQESAKAFVQGLGGENQSFAVTDPSENDTITRPYKMCEKYATEVLNSPHIKGHMNIFYNTPEFKQLQDNIQKRLGLDKPPTAENVTGLYDLCRFYRSYSITKRSPWCAVFSKEDLQVIEYVEDIRHYYRNGYGGSPTTPKLGALPLKHLFDNFKDIINEDSKHSFTAFFTHDTMLEMVYSALGLYWDYPEISGHFRNAERKWRASFMVPFAANFAAVLYRCPVIDGGDTYKVQFFINEVEVPLCRENACNWGDFLNKFEHFSNSTMDFCKEEYVHNHHLEKKEHH